MFKISNVDTDQIPFFRLLAFAMPAFISALVKGPTASILPTIYAKYHGIDLVMIGTILMVTRMFDAVTDPAIGYLSDRTKSPIGKRKPWVIGGYAMAMIVIYFLFIPPEHITTLFFLFWYSMLYLAWTAAEIPYLAWQAELSHDYKQRTRIVTYRTIMLTIGGMAFAAFPMLPIFETSEFTPEVLRIMAYAALIGLPLTVFLSVTLAPEGKPIATQKAESFFVMLKSIPKNKPMLIFIAILLLFGLASGMQISVLFLWLDTYLLIGHKFPFVLLISGFVGLGAMPVWLKVINRIGKHQAWLALQIGFIVIMPFFILLKPGPQSFVPFTVLYCLVIMIVIGNDIIPPAILGDVIDYDTLQSGQNRAGQYSSVLTLILKANFAVGTGIGFFLVGKTGYNATATVHSSGEVAGLMAVLVWIPMVLSAITCFFVWRYPLDERRQSIIKRRIESLAARKARLETKNKNLSTKVQTQ